MWALPFRLHYTDCTRGHCPYSSTLNSIVLALAQLQGMPPEGWGGCSQCLATNLSGSSAGGNPAEMRGQPKHAASPVPGSHAGSCLKHFLQSVHLDITASSGKGVFSVQLQDRRPFQLLSHWALEMGQAGLHTARFFGLKVEIAGTGPFPTSSSVPLRWRQERHSQAVELLWVETRNTEPSEASGRQLVHGVGVVPGAGASGCLPPPLRPVAILEPGEAHTFTGSAVAAERAGAQPRPAGRGEGQR